MLLQREMKLVVGHRHLVQITTFLTHSRQSSEVGPLETQLRGVVTTGSPLSLSSPPRAPSRPQQGINWVRSCLEVNRIVPTGSMTGSLGVIS